MAALETDVVVIGGGVTGVATLWDLSLRGIDAVLVDRSDLGTGTSGRWHGELHSGARYVVKDQQSARECVRDNTVLRRVAPHTIEDNGGIFVLLPEHDPAYAEKFVTGAAQTGVPCEEVAPAEARRREPALTDRIERAFVIASDGGMDSWKLMGSMVEGAKAHGNRVLTRHPVIGFDREGSHLRAVHVHDEVGGEDVTIACQWVINSSGAWAGRIGQLAGVPITMVPGKGTMVVMASRYVRSVISHCRPPSDGDIVVPAHETVILGTTSVEVEDPDDITVEAGEVDLMVEEGSKLVPSLATGRVLRAFAGVRPLYKPEDEGEVGEDTREVSRTYTVLDHAERDGVENFVSIVGGKLTTCLGMAEHVVNIVLEKKGVDVPCTTATTPMPGADHGIHHLQGPLAHIEEKGAYGALLCECELVTRSRIEASVDAGTTELDDLRRTHRLGFGPCQAAFCAWRAAAVVAERRPDAGEPHDNLRRFMAERWRGQRTTRWGGGVVQGLLNDAIYRGIFALDTLEAPAAAEAQAAATHDPASGYEVAVAPGDR